MNFSRLVLIGQKAPPYCSSLSLLLVPTSLTLLLLSSSCPASSFFSHSHYSPSSPPAPPLNLYTPPLPAPAPQDDLTGSTLWLSVLPRQHQSPLAPPALHHLLLLLYLLPTTNCLSSCCWDGQRCFCSEGVTSCC